MNAGTDHQAQGRRGGDCVPEDAVIATPPYTSTPPGGIMRHFALIATLLLTAQVYAADGPAVKPQPALTADAVHILCSSHNDLGWRGTPEHHLGVQRNVIRQSLARLAVDPEYRFNLEMALSLQHFLEHPTTTAAEKEAVLRFCREGRLHVGASWSQPPESSVADEVLARNFLLGRNWLKSLGIDSTVYWNVDTPGRALQIGQVCQQAGVKYLVLSRHTYGPQRWRSPDGSSVVAWSPWGDAYFWGMKANLLGPNPDAGILNRVHQAVEAMSKVVPSRDASLLFSIDECGPQNADALIRAWNQAKPAGPKMAYSTMPVFLERATANHELPITYGEQPDVWMYEFHPGHRRSYDAWRRAGERLPAAETWASIRALVEQTWSNYPAAKVQTAWRETLTMDHAWRGGRIDVESREIWQRALGTAVEVETQSLAAIAARVRFERPRPVVVFNELNWSRRDNVELALPAELDPKRVAVIGADGKVRASQLTSDGKLCFVTDAVPGLGWTTYYLGERSAPVADAPPPAPGTWENATLKLVLGEAGLRSLKLKANDCEFLRTDAFQAGEFCSMRSTGQAASEAGGIGGPVAGSLSRLAQFNPTWRTVEHGPVRTIFRLEGKTVECGVLLDVICWQDLPRIDLNLQLQGLKIAKGRELRIALPVGLVDADAAVRYGVPYGWVEAGKDDLDRAPGWHYRQKARDICLREANRWISVSATNAGLAIGTSELVFDTRDPDRSLKYPVIMPLLLASVLESENGDHQHRFSLCPHDGGWQNGWRHAWASQTPLRAVLPDPTSRGSLPVQFAPLVVDGEGVLLTAFKKSEQGDTVVLRLVEMHRQRGATCTIRGQFTAAQSMDLLENNTAKLSFQRGELPLSLKPAQIQSVRLEEPSP